MKRFTLAMTALAAITFAPMATAQSTSLDVTITGLSKLSGSVRIALFQGEDAWKSSDASASAVLEVSSETITTAFEDLEPGTYGIKMFHDVDGDGEMDTNPFGMPSEPYAFSNNARGRFGPAKWKDASFEVSAEGALQSITLK